MKLKCFCNWCNKARMIGLTVAKRGNKIYLKGYCPYCGSFWCKLQGRVSQYAEHDNEPWYDEYKYDIQDENFQGVISDGKISSD